MSSPTADVGILGGSGFYALLDDLEEVPVETPYGPPSDPPLVGEVGGRRVAFIPRHGKDHRFPPHRVPYQANLWALRSLGVRQVLAPSAVGGPARIPRPGHARGARPGRRPYVRPDADLLRRGRRPRLLRRPLLPDGTTYASSSPPPGRAGRRPTAAPSSSSRVRGSRPAPSPGGTPRNGWSVVGMTGIPEAVLARELALCYTTVALVTDLDAGVETGEGVTHAEVLEVFGREVSRLRDLLVDVVERAARRGRTDLLRAGRCSTACTSPSPCREPGASSRVLTSLGRQALRHRRLLAAGLFAGAVACALAVLAPPSAPTAAVVVATRPLDAGVQLRPADLRIVASPRRQHPGRPDLERDRCGARPRGVGRCR